MLSQICLHKYKMPDHFAQLYHIGRRSPVNNLVDICTIYPPIPNAIVHTTMRREAVAQENDFTMLS